MPIHINLLAEAQATEETRRRDPVKKFLLGGGAFIGLFVAWCLVVQAQIMGANGAFKKVQGRWLAIEKDYSSVTGNLKSAAEIEGKLLALNRLSTNRFLIGSALDALQRTVVEQVQATKVKTDQVFTLVESVPARTNGTRVVAGKPATAVEKIAITIEAKDWRPVDQNYNRFKEAIASFPVFQTNLTKPDALRLTSLSKPSYDVADPVTAFVVFTLEMQFPEIRRHD